MACLGLAACHLPGTPLLAGEHAAAADSAPSTSASAPATAASKPADNEKDERRRIPTPVNRASSAAR